MRKARALDPDHPELLALEEAKKFYTDPARSMGGGAAASRWPSSREAPDSSGLRQDLDLPEVDFSFAGLAEDDYSDGGSVRR